MLWNDIHLKSCYARYACTVVHTWVIKVEHSFLGHDDFVAPELAVERVLRERDDLPLRLPRGAAAQHVLHDAIAHRRLQTHSLIACRCMNNGRQVQGGTFYLSAGGAAGHADEEGPLLAVAAVDAAGDGGHAGARGRRAQRGGARRRRGMHPQADGGEVGGGGL